MTVSVLPGGRLVVDNGQWSRQIQQGAELMERAHAYAKEIGCTTYDDGALYDSIEVHTSEQSRLLAEWWAANTKPKSREADPRGGGPLTVGKRGSPKMKSIITRLFVTAIILALWGGLTNVVSPAATLVLGKQAVQQLNPSDADYLQTVAVFSAYRGVNWLVTILGVLALVGTWLGPIGRAIKSTSGDLAALLALALLGGMAFAPSSAHAYYDKTDYAEWRNILPNQSAFLIPSVGDNKNSQGQFGSAEYLDKNKVAAKRVQIPHTKLENSGVFSNFVVPAATLIIVDRTPFYREWTNATDKGTSKAKEGFTCESAESLNISTAIAISATVEELNAAKFLYWFGVKPVKGDQTAPEIVFTSTMDGVSLSEVMDTVVRGKVHASLCLHMGTRKLDAVFAEKAAIIGEVEKDVKDTFGPMGITIGFVGFADALDYSADIQVAINHVYTAQKNADAAAKLVAVLPVLQQEADMDVKRGIAEGIRTKGIPTLPSFVVLPQSWIDGAASFFNTAAAKVSGALGTAPAK